MVTRRGAFMLLAAVLAATVAVPALAAPPQDDQLWLVTLDDAHPSTSSAEALATRHGGSARHVYSHALNGFSFQGSERNARALERHPAVTRVEADQPVQAAGHVTPTGVTRIGAPDAHLAGHTGSDVKIAILDTGIAEHPALDVDAGLGTNCVDPGSNSTTDVNSHGTHVAGTASASLEPFVGAATAAQVVPVKVLDDAGSGSWATVMCGIDHVTAHAGTIAVANMSLSGSGSAGSSCASSELRAAICASVAAGVTYTVAAGNNGSDVATSVPAAFPEVITVSGLDERRCVRITGGGPPRTTCDEGLASFSNYGSGVDVAAPGVGIYSTVPGGSYGTKSGTSMAAPHVAGVAALMVSSNADLTPSQIKDLLQGTGECPNGQTNTASVGACAGQGQWFGDPDGIAEPLLNAPRAASAAGEPPDDVPPPDDPVLDDPVAAFTFDCSELTCDFTDGSTAGGDLAIASRAWTFGDGATSTDTNPSHTYDAAGTYAVELTVTDSADQTDTVSQQVTVTAPDDGDVEGIDLTVRAYKVRGLQKVDLSWSGTDGSVDVWRDGGWIATVDGTTYTDEIDLRGSGSYAYVVCEADTTTCSGEAVAAF